MDISITNYKVIIEDFISFLVHNFYNHHLEIPISNLNSVSIQGSIETVLITSVPTKPSQTESVMLLRLLNRDYWNANRSCKPESTHLVCRTKFQL